MMKSPSRFAVIMLEPTGRTICGVGVGLVSIWPPKVNRSADKSSLGSSFPTPGEISVGTLSGELRVLDSGGLLAGLIFEVSLLVSVT